jgi:hypothetical protein
MQSQRPIGWHAQCGRHVRASGLRQVALTDSVMEGRARTSTSEDSAAIMRYRVNSNATDVGGQRTTAAWVWDVHRFEHLCGQQLDRGVYGSLLPLLWIPGQAFLQQASLGRY